MLNSLEMVISATLLSSLLGSVNGYLFSKWKFRGSDILFTLLVFGMFIPYQSILIPLIRFLQSVGLYGKLPGLVLVHVVYGLPITTLIFRNYFANVPNELIEAARIDGCGVLGTFDTSCCRWHRRHSSWWVSSSSPTSGTIFCSVLLLCPIPPHSRSRWRSTTSPDRSRSTGMS